MELSLVEEEEGVVAQAVVHLARAPKSHEVYHALGRVYKEIDGSGAQPNVPLHPALKINCGPPTANLWSDWSPQKGINRDKLDQRQKVRKSRF